MTSTPPAGRASASAWLAGSVLAVAFAAVGVLAFREWRHGQFEGDLAGRLAPIAQLPPFELVDQRGQAVSLATFGGRPFLVDFIFTRCGGQCPLLNQRMKKLAALLPSEEAVDLVSISVDPEFDTPEVLAAYVREQGINDPRWRVLTGEPAAVMRLVREGFLLALEAGQADPKEPILHSTRFVLVDGEGRIRRYGDAFDDADLESLAKDARQLAGRK
jgi:protein SCO1/2